MYLNCGPYLVRDWRKDDHAPLVKVANSRKLWRNMSHRFPHPYTAEDATWWLTSLIGKESPTHWAVEVDSCLAGAIGFDPGEGIYDKTGHFGYWLGEPWWNRGIMTAVVPLVVEDIFSRYGLVRLEARVLRWNPASMRVLEKCGFEKEAVLRKSAHKDGQLVDEVLYALVR